jgi:REP element-mobilizing transposase RayT
MNADEAKSVVRPAGWHGRGYLPHFDGGEIPQFITFRLGDSLPQTVLEGWRIELEKEAGFDIEVALRRRIEAYLDQGYGKCYLKDERVAAMIQDSLLFHDGKRYRLSAWVVMPNHVHFLATPCVGVELSDIQHSLKSYTAHEANKILGRTGQFWQQESFDRFIRDHKHFLDVVAYIENNPVKARLCRTPEQWPFSSAWFHVQKERAGALLPGAQASRLHERGAKRSGAQRENERAKLTPA